MSDLTHRLSTERPSRKLCADAANRIAELEQALIDIEMAQMLPNRALRKPLLRHVQNALYGEDGAARLNGEKSFA